MEYSVNDITWLQKSIESMESKGLSPKGRITATEVIKPTGEKSVRLVMDNVSRDFQSPIDAVDWIVESNMDLARRRTEISSVITGAIIGGAVSYTNKSDVLLGVSIGSIIALIASYVLVKGAK